MDSKVNDLSSIISKIDSDSLDSLCHIGSSNFKRNAKFFRIISVIIALVPVPLAIFSMLESNGTVHSLLLALIISLFGSAAAMDRPGAWVTKLLRKREEALLEMALRNAARYELAEDVELEWSESVLDWKRR